VYRFMRVEGFCCRAYYRRRNRLYCIQNDAGHAGRDLTFYRCSADGEPVYPVHMPWPEEFDLLIEP
jgi:hypothetical protein